ncbi:MAG: hypothetical protein LRZ84_14855, partial [Desertifilum sp.]|nr:hypothetical protein [Desertifilum sp.]
MWDYRKPRDFTYFTPQDIPAFLEYFEREATNILATRLIGAFVDGVHQTMLKLLSRETLPTWVTVLLRWRDVAIEAYTLGVPIGRRVLLGMEKILPTPNQVALLGSFKVTPEDIATVPPAIRSGFVEGASFSLSWIKNLSNDARSQMRDLIAINTLKNRNPEAAIGQLEQILRGDFIGTQDVEQIERWINQASEKVVSGIAHRARLIALTESSRMITVGALSALEQQDDPLCYVRPHLGSCPDCARLLDGRIFRTATIHKNLFANFGVVK